MILVTGGHGQLGQCFQQIAAQHPKHAFIFNDFQELDITDRKAVNHFFEARRTEKIRWCINCAAYTAVDKAETEPERAKQINVVGAKNLAAACAVQGIPFIHISTDYVYHNQQNTPFQEGDPVRPKSVYARTKLDGDLAAALRANPLTMVIRTSWVYSEFGHNFVKTMLRLGAEKPTLNVVFDQIGTPTYAPDLADAIWQIILKVENMRIEPEAIAGVWHYSNEGVTSWYDFAQAIMEIKNLPCRVMPIETKDFPTPAQRPPFSVLNKGKIKAAFGLDIPHWRESLKRCLAEL